MSKKIKCPKCSGGFIPTLDAFALGKANCPACTAEIPVSAAQASETLTDDNRARARFATGEPVLLDAQAGTDFDIQWMPPGEQTPVAHVNGEAREMKFSVKPNHAQAFDAMLQRLRSLAAAGQGDLPFIDFNHEDGAASGRPTQFYWGGDDPKKGGIRLKGKWTASGKAAVSGDAPEFTRFSPEWYFDDNDEPLAIGVNLGGLVNRAAFKTIASVKAGAANQQQKSKMTKEEMQALLTEALKPINTEIAALKAQAKGTETDPNKLDETALTKAIAAAMKPFSDKLDKFEGDAVALRKAQAKAAVQKHVQRGAILPDEKMPDGTTTAVDFYEGLHLANAANAEAVMNKLPGKVNSRIILGAGAGGTATAGAVEFSHEESQILAGARKLRETNKALASDAQAVEAFLKTTEGKALYETIHNQRVQSAQAKA